jgi:hypothetical protein
MMKLQEIFNHLKAAEFSQLNFGAGQGVIDTDDATDKVLSHVNLGLTDLFTRFELRVKRLVLDLDPDSPTTSYLLTSKRAVSKYKPTVPPADPAPVPYILDSTGDPFKDDVLLITRVYTDGDYELPLNRLDQPHSLLTSAMNRLEVPLSIVMQNPSLPTQLITSGLSVVYRANHTLIDPNVGAFDPDRLEIELPYSHLTALLYYVASRANNPVGLGQEFNAGNTYAAKYEAECLRLKMDGMEVQQRGAEGKFEERGFV